MDNLSKITIRGGWRAKKKENTFRTGIFPFVELISTIFF